MAILCHDDNDTGTCPPCNQRCNQVHQCTANTPAEPCTEVGADQPRPPRKPADGWIVGAVMALSCIFSVACIAWIARHF